MIIQLPGFPTSLITALCSRQELCDFALHHEERELHSAIGSQKRRDEFMLGRFAAKQALSKLDPSIDGPILRDPSGAPIWPASVIGSLSHSGDLAVAAVAKRDYFFLIGVDIQITSRSPAPKLLQRITSENERKLLEAAAKERGFTDQLVALLTFSAKESAMKALRPTLERMPRFDELILEIGSAQVRIHSSFKNGQPLPVYFMIYPGAIITLAAR